MSKYILRLLSLQALANSQLIDKLRVCQRLLRMMHLLNLLRLLRLRNELGKLHGCGVSSVLQLIGEPKSGSQPRRNIRLLISQVISIRYLVHKDIWILVKHVGVGELP